jgi:hypothetical protein
MFKLVEYTDLKRNEKYKIYYNSVEYTGRFKETTSIYPARPCIIVNFKKLYNVTKKEKAPIYVCFDEKAKYYKFLSAKPQEKMERRAVNLIVRRLIGDECFEW